MTAMKVTDASLNAFPLYEHGMYAVFETAALDAAANRKDHAFRKKHMFIVFPTYLAYAEPPFVAGNHFTFLVNHDAKEAQRLQFHLTQYYPNLPYQGVTLPDSPVTQHHKNNLPLRFPLADDAETFKSQMLNRHYTFAVPLHALFRKGTARPTAAVAQQQHGGAKRRGATRSAGRGKASQAERRRGARQQTFDDLWRELPLHSMTVIGYDVSVSIQNRLIQPDEYLLKPCCRFRSATMEPEDIQERIVQHALEERWNWETFTTVPSDEEDD